VIASLHLNITLGWIQSGIVFLSHAIPLYPSVYFFRLRFLEQGRVNDRCCLAKVSLLESFTLRVYW
jgi:hypothetical protein